MRRCGECERERERERSWDPWRAASSRPRLTVERRALGGRKGLWQRDRFGDLILLDEQLDPVEERAVLTHELIHAERGIGWGGASAVTMAKEEFIVRCETARRLVADRDLWQWLVERADEPTGVADVAAHFEVPSAVAELALRRLRSTQGGRLGR
jgi:hypothetical protein